MASTPKQTFSPEAQNLHQESIIVDLHVDPIIQQALFGYHLSEEDAPTWQPQQRRWLFSSSGHSDDRIILAKEPADIRTAFKQGKLAGFPVIEGVHCLGKPGKTNPATTAGPN